MKVKNMSAENMHRESDKTWSYKRGREKEGKRERERALDILNRLCGRLGGR